MRRTLRSLLAGVSTIMLLGGSTTSCSCAWANEFDLPDDDSVGSITLGGPDCDEPQAKCDSTYDSGRCRRFVAAAADGARCVLSVEVKGRVVTFDAEYGAADGCMSCGTSGLPNEDVERVVNAR